MALNVLLVEDEIVFQTIIADYLDGTYNLTIVDSGQDAIAKIGEEDFNLLIVDLHLPDMHGTDIIRRAAQLAPESAILVLTSDTTPETIQTTIQAGADSYVVKPVDKANLHMRIEASLAKRRIAQK